MVTVTITPKGFGSFAIDTMTSNFSTTSTSFVDITNFTFSVPDENFYGTRIDFKDTSAARITSFALDVVGVNKEILTISSVSRTTKSTKIYQNSSGAAITVKGQLKTNVGDTTATIFATGNESVNDAASVLASAPKAISKNATAEGINIPIKIDLTSIKGIVLDVNSVVMMGGELLAFKAVETTVTLNTLSNGISLTSEFTDINLLWDWSGDRIEVS